MAPISNVVKLLLTCAALVTSTACAATLTVLRQLDSASEGVVTFAPLIQGADGYYYGVAREGGGNNAGTIFRIYGDGTNFAVLSSFEGTGNGANPEGALVQARDGQFYGTTFAGGVNGYGTVFQLTETGDLSVIQSLNNAAPGGNPSGRLLLGSDGGLYGTASFGGTTGYGTVFRTNVPDGATSAVSTFAGGPDGTYPESDLIQGIDGAFYGTTIRGGAADLGTFFRLTPSGDRQIIYNFTGGDDGSEPLRGVVQAATGDFYGIARTGGVYNGGVLYKLKADGSFLTLYSFNPTAADPYNSYGALTLASDGDLYGVTYQGGQYGAGTIFRSDVSGNLVDLYDFTGGADGGYPRAGLTQGNDGVFYGTTSGLNGNFSTVYSLDEGLAAPAPVIASLASSSIEVGGTVGLTGNYFVGTTAVNFAAASNATVAATSFTVLSNNYLEAVVPANAVSGPVTVVANNVTGASATSLTVIAAPPPNAVLPVVSLQTKDGVAAFAGSNTGKLKVVRSGGDVSQPLVVVFKVTASSSAVRDTDYTLVQSGVTLSAPVNSVTIAAGANSASLKIVPIDGSTPQPDKTVVLKLKPGANYTLGSPVKGVVAIAGDQ